MRSTQWEDVELSEEELSNTFVSCLVTDDFFIKS